VCQIYSAPTNIVLPTPVLHASVPVHEVSQQTQKQKVPRIIQVLKVIFEVKTFPIQVSSPVQIHAIH
jgi:hypothetical protein